MNFFTHIAISKILYNQIKSKINLNKSAFIYGNIKPDLSSKLMKKPHTMDNYFNFVCSRADNLIRGEETLKDFSLELGEICHYVCDFFCLYHTEIELFNNLNDHFLYELKLHFILKKFTQKEKSEIVTCNKEASRDFASIISSRISEYSADTSLLKKDISYAISTSAWICESVACFVNAAAETVSDNEMDSCPAVYLSGGHG